MRFDQTQIAVRERAMLDIFDIALHVTRVYAWPLLVTFSFGVLPLMVVNHLLVGWMSDITYEEQFPYRFLWNMMLLVYVEASLASVFATCFLGQAVFHERPKLRQVLTDVTRLFPRIALCQLILRVVLPVWVLYLFLDRDYESVGVIDLLFVPALALLVLVMRSFRPFINEIIVLERNPLRSSDSQTQSVGVRSSRLHGPASGELFARSLGGVFIGVLLWMAFYGLFLFISGVVFNEWRQRAFMVNVCYPLSPWMVVLYFTVVNFLSYLDVRIRQEGWEVELQLRAEAARLTSKMI